MPVLLCAVWAACARTEVNDSAIYLARGIEVYPDSIIVDGKYYVALNADEITRSWRAPQADSTGGGPSHPALTSSSRMADALWHKSMNRRAERQLTALDIYLTGALLDPQGAIDALRNMTSGGTIVRNGFPLESGNDAWAAAAMEVYRATGSEQWLREAYRIINATYYKEISTLTAGDGLIHGSSPYMLRLKGYYPAWMQPVDRFQAISLTTNMWHYATLNTAAAMARLLRLKAERDWEDFAAMTHNSINDLYWIPTQSYYGQYLYGDLYPILSPAADNIANPLAVLLGIATPEMAARIAGSRPSLPKGMPTVYPVPADGEPHFDPYVQALNGIAAARAADEEALLSATGSVWRMSLADHADMSWPSLLLRGIMGIELSADGLTFNPTVPPRLASELSLKGLRYRSALLDINIQGSGDKIASFAIDSVRTSSHTVSPDLQGRHRIDIVMAGNRLSEHPATPNTTRSATAPDMPRLYWIDERECKIINFDPATTYEIYTDGILTETINTSNYSVTDTGTTVTDIVPVLNGINGFAPRSHVTAPPRARMHVPATAITPRRPPLHLIQHRETASRYIELAARHNTRLTFYVQAPDDGTWFVNIAYANGSDETAMRTLEVNDSYAGTLVCPALTRNDWVTTRPSSTLRVYLHKGVNKLSLTYINSTILLHDIYLLRK